VGHCCSNADNLLGTQEVGLYRVDLRENDVYLLDTPGFDNAFSTRTDEAIFNLIDVEMRKHFRNRDKSILGLILLHDVSVMRLTGSDVKV
jgi:hypothetical protein